MRKSIIALCAVLIAGLGAVAVQAAIPDEDGNFYACVNKATGAVRLIEQSDSCKSSESRKRWPSVQRAVQKTYTVYHTVAVPANGIVTHAVNCRAGDVVTGGAAYFHREIVVDETTLPKDEGGIPTGTPTAWEFTLTNTDTANLHVIDVFAVCLEAN